MSSTYILNKKGVRHLSKEFYVYEWFIVETLETFYVGKGKGLRRFEEKHQRNQYFINIINKYECAVRLYKSNLTEEEAFKIETERIYYLKSLGLARANLAKGGKGGDTYSYQPKKKKRELSRKITDRNHARWSAINEEGRKAFGRKISNSIKKNGSLKGKRNPMYGKTHSDETRKIISLKNTGKTLSKETKQKMSLAQIGEKNHMFGRSLKNIMSEEDFESYKERHLESCQSEEVRQKHREIALERYKDKTLHPMYGKSGENAVNGKAVLMLDENQNIVKEFKSIRLALDFLGLKGHSGLNKAIKSNRQYKGYYWTHKD